MVGVQMLAIGLVLFLLFLSAAAWQQNFNFDSSQHSYLLSQSSDIIIWTAPITKRIRVSDIAPKTVQQCGIVMSAAKREWEPFQIIFSPQLRVASLSVQLTSFASQDSSQVAKLYRATFSPSDGSATAVTNGLLPLTVGSDGASAMPLSSTQPSVLWVTLFVPPTAPAGMHYTQMTLKYANTSGIASLVIPVTMYVFDFTLPSAWHFHSQIAVDMTALSSTFRTVDLANGIMYNLKMSPRVITTPSGLDWFISWDNPDPQAAAFRCNVFNDEAYAAPQYSGGYLAKRYALGVNWLEGGFTDFRWNSVVDDLTPRPANFCGVPIGPNAFGSADYNNAYAKFLKAAQDYLTAADHSFWTKAYWQVQNNLNKDSDFALAYFLCNFSRSIAPSLRIAVQSEPRDEITRWNASKECGFDIWLSPMTRLNRNVAQRRIVAGEQVWLMSQSTDRSPYPTPASPLATGTNIRSLPWIAWTLRASGWLHASSLNSALFPNGQPGVAAELFREACEDFEYLYLANGGSYPSGNTTGAVDRASLSLGFCLTVWETDPALYTALRFQLGAFIEKSRSDVPTLGISVAPRKAYYLSFQEPSNSTVIEPLIFNGQTWIKIGWFGFSRQLGYGWCAGALGASGLQYGLDSVDGNRSVIERSFVYDTSGNYNQFHYAIENGIYQVEVALGVPSVLNNTVWQYADVEGQVLQFGAVSGLRVFSTQVFIADNLLSIGIGRFGSSNVTQLSYMIITPIGDTTSLLQPDNGPVAAAATAGCPLTAGNSVPAPVASSLTTSTTTTTLGSTLTTSPFGSSTTGGSGVIPTPTSKATTAPPTEEPTVGAALPRGAAEGRAELKLCLNGLLLQTWLASAAKLLKVQASQMRILSEDCSSQQPVLRFAILPPNSRSLMQELVDEINNNTFADYQFVEGSALLVGIVDEVPKSNSVTIVGLVVASLIALVLLLAGAVLLMKHLVIPRCLYRPRRAPETKWSLNVTRIIPDA